MEMIELELINDRFALIDRSIITKVEFEPIAGGDGRRILIEIYDKTYCLHSRYVTSIEEAESFHKKLLRVG
jgi:hypothetical protein